LPRSVVPMATEPRTPAARAALPRNPWSGPQSVNTGIHIDQYKLREHFGSDDLDSSPDDASPATSKPGFLHERLHQTRSDSQEIGFSQLAVRRREAPWAPGCSSRLAGRPESWGFGDVGDVGIAAPVRSGLPRRRGPRRPQGPIRGTAGAPDRTGRPGGLPRSVFPLDRYFQWERTARDPGSRRRRCPAIQRQRLSRAAPCEWFCIGVLVGQVDRK
jgi:hypothetical protein